jgi:hypothetical protein
VCRCWLPCLPLHCNHYVAHHLDADIPPAAQPDTCMQQRAPQQPPPRCSSQQQLPLPPAAAAIALGDLLATSRCMQRLLLQHCGIKPDVAAELADGLGRCVSLTHVDLSHNKVGDTGAATLGGALAGRAQLQVSWGCCHVATRHREQPGRWSYRGQPGRWSYRGQPGRWSYREQPGRWSYRGACTQDVGMEYSGLLLVRSMHRALMNAALQSQRYRTGWHSL